MLEDWEIASARATQLDAMPDLLDIYRGAGTPDTFGGITDGSTLIEEDVPCYVATSSLGAFTDDIIASRDATTRDYMISVPVGTDVRDGDRVIVASSERWLVVQRALDLESWDTVQKFEASYADSEVGDG